MSHACGVGGCAETGKYQCSACGSAYYCSKDHQIKDWAQHRLTCAPKIDKDEDPMSVEPASNDSGPSESALSGMSVQSAPSESSPCGSAPSESAASEMSVQSAPSDIVRPVQQGRALIDDLTLAAGPAAAPAGVQFRACGASGCPEHGLYECSRCGGAFYCSKSHQAKDWTAHRLLCDPKSGLGDRPVKPFVYPEYPPSRRRFLQSEMTAGPAQPMDPPAQFDYVIVWWRERSFVAPDGTSFKASFYPPQIKASIREGLQAKTLTWEYLCSDNFMDLIIRATVPTYRIETALTMMKSFDEKPFAARHIECVVEHYWRTKTCVGYDEFDAEMHLCLRENDLQIPFQSSYTGHFCDDLRRFTHDLGPDKRCGCYNCLRRPFMRSVEEASWERVRAQQSDKGRYIMSYKMYTELQDARSNEMLWQIDDSGPGQLKDWTYPPDDDKTIARVPHVKGQEVVAILDRANRESRLPTPGELDRIVSLVSVSKGKFDDEEDAFVASSLQAARVKMRELKRLARQGMGVSTVPSLGFELDLDDVSDSDDDDNDGKPPPRARPPSRAAAAAASAAAAAAADDDDAMSDDEGRPRRTCTDKVLNYAVAGNSDSSSESGEESDADESGGDDEDDDDDDDEMEEEDERGDAMDEEEEQGGARRRKPKGKSSSSSSGGGAAKKRSGGGGGGGGAKFSPEALEALREEVERAGEPERKSDGTAVDGTWNPIQEALAARGHVFTSRQIMLKWKQIKDGEAAPWTDAQWEEFKALVRSLWQEAWTKTPRGFYETVGAQLVPPRAGYHCKVKWGNMGSPLVDLKTGTYTPAEDAVILQHVAEHGAKNWPLVAKALNRNPSIVGQRYKGSLKK